jgi:mRNA interferase MazF
MRQGDLVILAFPYANMAHSKWRPAVVISNERYNKHANVLLAGVYGKKQPFSVRVRTSDVRQGKLRKESYVCLQNIFSADKSLVRASGDALNAKKLEEVIAALRKCL